jgi:activator of HSP90 ATPase
MAACRPEITTSAVFHVPAEVLYRIFTDERDMARLTRSPAKFSATVDSEFAFFNNNIIGTVSALSPPHSITLNWRFTSWSSDSTVVITFTSVDGTTCRISVRQSNIPATDRFGNVDQDRLCEVGWEEMWFGGLEHVLGLPRAK